MNPREIAKAIPASTAIGFQIGLPGPDRTTSRREGRTVVSGGTAVGSVGSGEFPTGDRPVMTVRVVARTRVPADLIEAAYTAAATLDTTEPNAAPVRVPLTPTKEAATAVVTAASAPPAIFVKLRSSAGVPTSVVSVVVVAGVVVAGVVVEGVVVAGLFEGGVMASGLDSGQACFSSGSGPRAGFVPGPGRLCPCSPVRQNRRGGN